MFHLQLNEKCSLSEILILDASERNLTLYLRRRPTSFSVKIFCGKGGSDGHNTVKPVVGVDFKMSSCFGARGLLFYFEQRENYVR